MNYKLAKELKDAGFRVKPDGHIRLEDLIEACGSPFQLNSFPVGNINDGTSGKVEYIASSPAFVGPPMGRGASYEEAVARLWLAINRKEV